MKGENLYSSIVYVDTKYGQISCHLKDVMREKKISIYQLSHISNIKYEIIKRYCDDLVLRYDANILARLCFCLDCELSSILKYEK